MDEIFAQEILALADAREHRAADEIAREHEEAEHHLMAEREIGDEPPSVDRRRMRRRHDVAEVQEGVGRMDGNDDQRADPAIGFDHLR